MNHVRIVKRDDALWLRHLADAGIEVPLGRAAIFLIDDVEVVFEPMKPSPNGRSTHGLRAAGRNRHRWTSIPKGSAVDVALVRVLDPPIVERGTVGAFDRPGVLKQRDGVPVTGVSVHSETIPIQRPPSQRSAFDAYIMVDWSASSGKKTGEDSVWWCLCCWCVGRFIVLRIENAATRLGCLEAIRSELIRLVESDCSVLVGFDFPFGYPAGFARKLGLIGHSWRGVWDLLAMRITDDQSGSATNNRFQVASDMNRMLGSSSGPFWGHPQDRSFANLRPTALEYPIDGLDRFRETERHARGAQPSWKLWGNGSVGSQALLGIPCVAALRDDPALTDVARVWPFETGAILPRRGNGPRIIIAEIYPSLVALPVDLAGQVKDCVQVKAIAQHLADSDTAGVLDDLFSAPANLGVEKLQRVVDEEGWILGVRPSATTVSG